MTELETKLGQALTDQAKSKDMFDALVDELKQAIAVEAKPKLRHGDYRLAKHGGSPRLYIKGSDGDMCWCDNDAVKGSLTAGSDNEPFGNIFDDLTAMQEDVTEFTAGGNNFTFTTSGGIHIEDDNDMEAVVIKSEDIPAVILGLRQMQATQRRKEAGK